MATAGTAAHPMGAWEPRAVSTSQGTPWPWESNAPACSPLRLGWARLEDQRLRGAQVAREIVKAAGEQQLGQHQLVSVGPGGEERGRLLAHAEGPGAEAKLCLERQGLLMQLVGLEGPRRRLMEAAARDLAGLEAQRRRHSVQVARDAASLDAERAQLFERAVELDAERVAQAELSRSNARAQAVFLEAAAQERAELGAQQRLFVQLELERTRLEAEVESLQRLNAAQAANLDAERQRHAGEVEAQASELEAESQRLSAQAAHLEAMRRQHATAVADLEAARRQHAAQVLQDRQDLEAEKRQHAARVAADREMLRRERTALRAEKLSSIVCQWRHVASLEKDFQGATDWSKHTFVDITEEHGSVSMQERPPRALEVALQRYFGQQYGDAAFGRLSQQQIGNVVKSMAPHTLHEGDVVMRQGDLGADFFLVESGSLQVVVDGQYQATLKTCDAFGDRALLNDEPRAATVKVVSTSAKLWSMDKEAFMKHSQLRLEACIDSLTKQGAQIFRNLSRKHLESLMSAARLRVYPKGTVVVRQGEEGSTFFVVESGQLRVLVDGREVRLLSGGEYFGELALLKGDRRSATLQVASKAAELWLVEREHFLKHSQHMLRH